MAKWKWFERRDVISGAVQAEAVDYGWCCGACNAGLRMYLRMSGFTIERPIVVAKRNPPLIEFCPHCGEKMEVKNAAH